MHLFRIASAAFSTGPPKGWFYTVYTHYSHSLLKADPVTHIFPAAGPPSLDVPPTCHPSVWSLTKEKQRDWGKRGGAKLAREMFQNMTVISGIGVKKEKKGNKVKKECLCINKKKKPDA